MPKQNTRQSLHATAATLSLVPDDFSVTRFTQCSQSSLTQTPFGRIDCRSNALCNATIPYVTASPESAASVGNEGYVGIGHIQAQQRDNMFRLGARVPRNPIIELLSVVRMFCGLAALSALSNRGAASAQSITVSGRDLGRVPSPEIRGGCSTFEVQIEAEGLVTLVPVPATLCGPVTPVIANGRVDRGHEVLHLSVAVRNDGVLRLHQPVLVTADSGSLVPEQQGGGRPRFLGKPSEHASRNHQGGMQWSFDGSIPKAEESASSNSAKSVSQYLGPRATSSYQIIDIALSNHVKAFKVTLGASGRIVFTVPDRAPSRTDTAELRDSRSSRNVLTNDTLYAGHLVRNKLWVRFKPTATEDDRQAAIDSVDGVVVGGSDIGVDGLYYVRIPAPPNTRSGPVRHAMAILANLPQVARVLPDLLDR